MRTLSRMPWLMTSDEASLRRCTAAVAVTFVGLVSARLLAQAITLWTAQREDTIALRTAERFRSRVSDICQHGLRARGEVPSELAELPDGSGEFMHSSAVDSSSLFFRAVLRGQALHSFEWSVDRRHWLPTSNSQPPDGQHLAQDHRMLLARLEAERLLIAAGAASADPITHPPALDLPRSLRRPDSVPSTLSLPADFRCPLGSGVMTSPVVTPSGLSYERCASCPAITPVFRAYGMSSIEDVIRQTGKDPATGQPLTLRCLYPNLALRDLIQEWTITNAEQLDPQIVQRLTKDAVAVDGRSRASRASQGAAVASQAGPPERVIADNTDAQVEGDRAGQSCQGMAERRRTQQAQDAASPTDVEGASTQGCEGGAGAIAGQAHDRHSMDELSHVNALFVPTKRCMVGSSACTAKSRQR